MAKCVGDLNIRDCSIYLDDIVILPKTLKNKSKSHSSVLAVAEAWPDPYVVILHFVPKPSCLYWTYCLPGLLFLSSEIILILETITFWPIPLSTNDARTFTILWDITAAS